MWWQLKRRLQPVPCARPGQELRGRSWLGLAFVPLALLSLSRRELLPSQRRVPRGQQEGHPDGSRAPEGLGYGVPPGHRAPPGRRRQRGGWRGEDGGEEGGRGDGLEARRCGCAPLRPRPHRDEREGKGRGRGGGWGPPKPKPQPGLTLENCGEGESRGGRTAGQTAPSHEY